MTRFTFRLQRVLELRKKKEEALAVQHVAAQVKADAARDAREALEQVRMAGREQLHAAHLALTNVGELRQRGLVVEALDQRVAQAATTYAAAEQAVKRAQEQLAAAHKDRRVLDRLRERQALEWREEATRRETMTMDEVALGRFTQELAPDATGDEDAR